MDPAFLSLTSQLGDFRRLYLPQLFPMAAAINDNKPSGLNNTICHFKVLEIGAPVGLAGLTRCGQDCAPLGARGGSMSLPFQLPEAPASPGSCSSPPPPHTHPQSIFEVSTLTLAPPFSSTSKDPVVTWSPHTPGNLSISRAFTLSAQSL